MPSTRPSFCLLRFLPVVALGAVLAGCSAEQRPAPAASGQRAAQASPTDPAAIAASRFLNAVIAGDTEGATALLTPAAIDQFRSNGKRFAPPGLETATFRTGEVMYPDPAKQQAAVQCIVQERPQPGEQPTAPAPTAAEMVCLLKLVGAEWRVSGIAYEVSPNQKPLVLDFEKLPAPVIDPARTAAQPAADQSGLK